MPKLWTFWKKNWGQWLYLRITISTKSVMLFEFLSFVAICVFTISVLSSVTIRVLSFVTIFVFAFCHSFNWVLLLFEFLSSVTIGFFLALSQFIFWSYVTIWVFELSQFKFLSSYILSCYNFSFWFFFTFWVCLVFGEEKKMYN